MDHLKTGNIGESIACKFLKQKGYTVLDRNSRKKFGEIDIIAEKKGVTNFVEVKTITSRLGENGEILPGTSRPEEKVDAGKLKRIGRAIKAYVEEKSVESEWEFKVITVIFDPEQKLAKVSVIEDVVPE